MVVKSFIMNEALISLKFKILKKLKFLKSACMSVGVEKFVCINVLQPKKKQSLIRKWFQFKTMEIENKIDLTRMCLL